MTIEEEVELIMRRLCKMLEPIMKKLPPSATGGVKAPTKR